MKRKIKIGPVENLVLFGGGPLVVAFAKAAMKRKIRPTVFAVQRHLQERVDPDNRLTLEAALEKEGIPCFHARDINTAPELAAVLKGKTLGIGLGEAYTFTQETIDRFHGMLFDFMVIKLPQYRGGAHFTWQILREDRVGCWNIQTINAEMVPGVFDSGALIKTHEYTLPDTVRVPADYFRIAHAEGLNLFAAFMDEVQAGKSFEALGLNEAGASYFPRLSTVHQAWIDWSWTRDEIVRFICAFDDPYPGASTFVEGRRVFLKQSQAAPEAFASHPFLSGLIYRLSGGSVFVAAASGALVAQGVYDAKGRDIIADLRVGQRFHTPIKTLEAARCYRAEYNMEGLVRHD